MMVGYVVTHFARPEFGIKAKRTLKHRDQLKDFARPEFGIKAKLNAHGVAVGVDFARPEFGIKAKRTRGERLVAWLSLKETPSAGRNQPFAAGLFPLHLNFTK